MIEDRIENTSDPLLDVRAMADHFSISKRSVWRLVALGELPPPVRIGRCARWFRADVSRFEKALVEKRVTAANGELGR